MTTAIGYKEELDIPVTFVYLHNSPTNCSHSVINFEPIYIRKYPLHALKPSSVVSFVLVSQN